MVKLPIGWVAAAAGALLALSPEARTKARRLAVRGTELALDAADELRSRWVGLQQRADTRDQGEAPAKAASAPAAQDEKPAAAALYETAPETVNFKNIYNVVNDDVIRKQVETIQMNEFGSI